MSDHVPVLSNDGDVLIDSKSVDIVMNALRRLFIKYEQITVADLRELLGLPVTYLDHKWGWAEFPENLIVKARQEFWVVEISSAQLLV